MTEKEISTTLARCRTLAKYRSIALERTISLRRFQRHRLARCWALTIASAAIIASLLFGEPVR